MLLRSVLGFNQRQHSSSDSENTQNFPFDWIIDIFCLFVRFDTWRACEFGDKSQEVQFNHHQRLSRFRMPKMTGSRKPRIPRVKIYRSIFLFPPLVGAFFASNTQYFPRHHFTFPEICLQRRNSLWREREKLDFAVAHITATAAYLHMTIAHFLCKDFVLCMRGVEENMRRMRKNVLFYVALTIKKKCL